MPIQNSLDLKGALTLMKPFREVPPEIVAEAERRCALLRVERHQMLFASGDRGDNVYFVIEGQVRCLYHSAAGRLLTLAEIGPGEMVGEIAAIDGLPRTVDVVALAATVLVVMPAPIFRSILYRHEPVARGILQDMSRRMRVMTDRMIELSTLEVGARVRSELLRIAEQHPLQGTAVAFPAPRHADIGSRISANREAVTREMVKLTRAGLLERRQQELVIGNLARFRSSLADLVDGLPRFAME